MDEILFFETCAFEIWCEKERWASGRVVRTVEMDDGVESGRRGAAEKRTNEDLSLSSSNENESDGDGDDESARRSSPYGWALELDASVPALVASAGVSFFGDEKKQNAAAQTPSSPAVPVLGLELCLVGTCRRSPRDTRGRAPGVEGGEPRASRRGPRCASSPRDELVRAGPRTTAAATSRTEDRRRAEKTRANAASRRRVGRTPTRARRRRARLRRDAPGAAAAGAVVDRPVENHAVAFDRAEVLRNVRKRYEDLMREYHDSGSELRGASDGCSPESSRGSARAFASASGWGSACAWASGSASAYWSTGTGPAAIGSATCGRR